MFPQPLLTDIILKSFQCIYSFPHKKHDTLWEPSPWTISYKKQQKKQSINSEKKKKKILFNFHHQYKS